MPPSNVSIDLGDDVLSVVMSKASSISELLACKVVCSAWHQSARASLCDIEWLCRNDISLHELLKRGRPSPRLATALIAARPELLRERDGEGLLPLQYAAAYRLDADLVAAIRKATVHVVPGGVAGMHPGARSLKLRPVRTRVRQAPIAA
jgi:hypothetical protein